MGFKDLGKEQKERHEREMEEAQASLRKLKPMPLPLVQTEIDKINEFFADSPWMELNYGAFGRNEIRLHGSIDDKAYPEYDEIEIVFYFPQAFSGIFYDLNEATRKPFIALETVDRFRQRAGLPVYSEDCFVFKLANEDDTNNYIVALGIRSFLRKS